MSNDRLNAIRERLGKATPGPWTKVLKRTLVDGSNQVFQTLADYNGHATNVENDATFIAHAPEDIAWLIQRVEDLQGERLAQAVSWARSSVDAGQARIAALEEGLRSIAFIGTDCALAMDETSFYRYQLYEVIGIATRLLSTPQPQAKEEVVCTCGAAFDVGRYCTCKEDGDGRPD